MRKAREVVNESAWSYDTNTGNFAWNLDVQPNLFLRHTSGDDPAISVGSSLVGLRPARIFTLVLWNNTGVGITPAFSSDFSGPIAPVANGAIVAYRFMVKHPDMNITATLIHLCCSAGE